MIAVDTNVLVAAHRLDAARHEQALAWVRFLAEGEQPWGIPFSCLGEFVRVVTHRRVFDPPSSIEQAIDAVDALLESPSVRLLNPSAGHWALFRPSIVVGDATGNLVFDAQIAALCREHGIDRLLSEDRDFRRFPALSLVTLDVTPGAQ
ncbi:MAG TPA: TA system VapC family ribonuclease toxin [Spirochaetia bacterium]|nr:TA system VapC family ribonuclease toxin [Spirochaetia bacterium]